MKSGWGLIMAARMGLVMLTYGHLKTECHILAIVIPGLLAPYQLVLGTRNLLPINIWIPDKAKAFTGMTTSWYQTHQRKSDILFCKNYAYSCSTSFFEAAWALFSNEEFS